MREYENIHVSELTDADFLIGKTVKEVRFGPAVRLVFDEGDRVEPAVYVELGKYTIYDSDGNVYEQDEREPEHLGKTLAIVGKRVKEISIGGGVLKMAFSDGSRLECKPSEDYEAWQVVSHDPKRILWSTTDGEVLSSP